MTPWAEWCQWYRWEVVKFWPYINVESKGLADRPNKKSQECFKSFWLEQVEELSIQLLECGRKIVREDQGLLSGLTKFNPQWKLIGHDEKAADEGGNVLCLHRPRRWAQATDRLLNLWTVAGQLRYWSFSMYLMVINLKYNSHMGPVALYWTRQAQTVFTAW